jgi:hypothetical protein
MMGVLGMKAGDRALFLAANRLPPGITTEQDRTNDARYPSEMLRKDDRGRVVPERFVVLVGIPTLTPDDQTNNGIGDNFRDTGGPTFRDLNFSRIEKTQLGLPLQFVIENNSAAKEGNGEKKAERLEDRKPVVRFGSNKCMKKVGEIRIHT